MDPLKSDLETQAGGNSGAREMREDENVKFAAETTRKAIEAYETALRDLGTAREERDAALKAKGEAESRLVACEAELEAFGSLVSTLKSELNALGALKQGRPHGFQPTPVPDKPAKDPSPNG